MGANMAGRLGAATGDDEEIAWDEDSDEESSTPNPQKTKLTSASQTTIQPVSSDKDKAADENAELLKPAEGRRSNDEKSQADSDASYDIVSGAPSRASGSPKEKKSEPVKEESDEDDWE